MLNKHCLLAVFHDTSMLLRPSGYQLIYLPDCLLGHIHALPKSKHMSIRYLCQPPIGRSDEDLLLSHATVQEILASVVSDDLASVLRCASVHIFTLAAFNTGTW